MYHPEAIYPVPIQGSVTDVGSCPVTTSAPVPQVTIPMSQTLTTEGNYVQLLVSNRIPLN